MIDDRAKLLNLKRKDSFPVTKPIRDLKTSTTVPLEEKKIPLPEAKSPSINPLDQLTAAPQKEPKKNQITLSKRYEQKDQKCFVQLEFALPAKRKIGKVLYPVVFDDSVTETQIGISAPIRNYLGYTANEAIPPVKLMTADKAAVLVPANSIDIQIRQSWATEASADVIDPEEFEKLFKMYFKDYPLTLNQSLLVPNPKNHNEMLEIVIRDINHSADKTSGNSLKFAVNEFSRIQLSLSYAAEITQQMQIAEVRKLNLDFQSYGIGGHGEKLAALIQTAFYSRVLPPEMREAYNLKHVVGVMLYGPPGTGKTLIGKNIGKIILGIDMKDDKDDPRIITISGSEIKSKMVGESVQNLRAKFAPAIKEWKEKKEKSDTYIILIDEIDALAPVRGSRSGGTGVDEEIVAALLTMLDGAESPGNILVIGTTNRLDMVDPALLRPGRISLHLEIALPDLEGRLQILRIHTRKQADSGLLEGVDLDYWAEKTENYTGAELKELVDEASRLANKPNMDSANSKVLQVRKDIKDKSQYSKITQKHFQLAFDKIVPKYGIDKQFVFDQDKFILFSQELADAKDKFEQSFRALKQQNGLNSFRFLVAGDMGCGKMEFAKYLATLTNTKSIKVISALDFIELPLSKQLEKLHDDFDDAMRSETSVIILNKLENLLQAEIDFSKPNNSIRIKLQALFKKIESCKNKCVVIATTSSEKFSHTMFPGMFQETRKLGNMVVWFNNPMDIEKLAEITKTFDVKLIPPAASIDDDRCINLPISKLIYEIKNFCFGIAKTSELNLDQFYGHLYGKPLRLPKSPLGSLSLLADQKDVKKVVAGGGSVVAVRSFR